MGTAQLVCAVLIHTGQITKKGAKDYMAYKIEKLFKSLDVESFEFIPYDGEFDAIYVARWFNWQKGLIVCFAFDDGKRVRAMTWKNTKYKKLDQIPLGAHLHLRFKTAGSGRTYLRSVTVLSLPEEPLDRKALEQKITAGFTNNDFDQYYDGSSRFFDNYYDDYNSSHKPIVYDCIGFDGYCSACPVNDRCYLMMQD